MTKNKVLTLLILENGLGASNESRTEKTENRLNPSYTGKWSRGFKKKMLKYLHRKVLTLLILENGLGASFAEITEYITAES